MDAADTKRDSLSFDSANQAPYLLDCGHAFSKASITELINKHNGACSTCFKKLSDSNKKIPELKGDLDAKLNPVNFKFYSLVEKNIETITKKFKAIEDIFLKEKEAMRKTADQIIDQISEGSANQLQQDEVAFTIAKLDERLQYFYCKNIYYETLFTKVASDLNSVDEKVLVSKLSENETIELYEKKLRNLFTQADLAYKDLDAKQKEIKEISTDYPDEDLKKALVNLKNLITDLIKLTMNRVKMNGLNPTNNGIKKYEDLRNKLNQKNVNIIDLEKKKEEGTTGLDAQLNQEKTEHDKIFSEIKKFIDDLDEDNKWLINNLEKEKTRILTLCNKFLGLVDPSKKAAQSGKESPDSLELKKKLMELTNMVEQERKGFSSTMESTKLQSQQANEKIKELEARLKEEQETKESLEETVSKLEKNISEEKQKVQHLQNETHSQKEEIEKQISQVNELTQQKEELTKQSEELNQEIVKKSDEINQLSESLEKEVDDHKKDVTQRDEEITNLKSAIETLTKEKDALIKQVEELQTTIQSRDTEITSLKDSLDVSTKKNEEFTQNVQELTQNNATLTQEKAKVEQELTEANSKIGTLETETASLNQNVVKLKGIMGERNTQIKELYEKFMTHEF
jgi:chromosome segregation ATPase